MAKITDKKTRVKEKAGRSRSRVLTKQFLKTVPLKPGVYLMKGEDCQVLYVGKAKELRKRLASYQQVDPTISLKTDVLMGRVRSIEFIMTHTEKEAFILEASLIKKHKPRFNIDLKDDKSYPLIKVTVGEDWPRVLMTRRRLKDGSRYFGPFASANAMRNTLDIIKRVFPLRSCKGKKLKKRSRPCLNHQMGRCLAPCTGQADPAQYREMVENILLILEGKNRQLLKQMNDEMQEAAAALEYEQAALLRDRLQALNKTMEKQVVVSVTDIDKDQDVVGYVRQGAGVALSFISVRQGMVNGQQTFFLLDPIGDDVEVLAEAVRRYYSRKQTIPHELLLPFDIGDTGSLAEWLSDLRGSRTQVRVPKRGGRLKLLRMAEQNARQMHIDQENRQRSWQELAAVMQTKMRLGSFPARIECLDISNISGKQPVGSLVCFIEGDKAGSQYRHYKISGADTPDDYRMMEEVLDRRFARDEKVNDLPDLLVLDGGKGQLNVARRVLENHKLLGKIELASIAKDREGKVEKIYRPGRKNPLSLAGHSPVLLFLMQIRDEAHRFGVNFHRRLRHKHAFASELDNIAGIGAGRKKMLLKELGSMAAVKRARVSELAAVNGIGPELAQHIWNYFHK
ncbi:MAG: excinuclease ABC subunit UvrC [Proteobacteria bacterium]|nr:excinuclease ABC subunit UvrC [Pseudomonadota bacterium]